MVMFEGRVVIGRLSLRAHRQDARGKLFSFRSTGGEIAASPMFLLYAPRNDRQKDPPGPS